jgi:hypothetical protein
MLGVLNVLKKKQIMSERIILVSPVSCCVILSDL